MNKNGTKQYNSIYQFLCFGQEEADNKLTIPGKN